MRDVLTGRAARMAGRTRWIDRQAVLLVATILTVLGCTALLRGDHGARWDIRRELPPADAGARTPYRLVVVLGPGDCEGGLAFIHLASRQRFRNTLSVTGVLVGTRAETRVAQQRLRARGFDLPLSARPGGLRAAGPIGYRSTPYLLLVDEEGRVRFAADLPSVPAEMREIEQAIRSIVLPER